MWGARWSRSLSRCHDQLGIVQLPRWPSSCPFPPGCAALALCSLEGCGLPAVPLQPWNFLSAVPSPPKSWSFILDLASDPTVTSCGAEGGASGPAVSAAGLAGCGVKEASCNISSSQARFPPPRLLVRSLGESYLRNNC